MPKKGNLVRRILYKVLPLESYLRVLSLFYFFSFDRGWLKGEKNYEYPYFLKNLVRDGDVCIDIGANLGYYSVLLSRIVGEKGKIYSVEPVKPIRSVLTRNTRGLKNVEILPFALGTENKHIQLGNNSVKAKGFMASGSHFVMDTEEDADVVFKAEMRKGSELFADLAKLDFVKCDIEGYEVIVLPELKSIFEKQKPTVLVETSGEARVKIRTFFEDMGYTSFVLDGEVLLPADKHPKWDILFVPEHKMTELSAYMEQ